MADRPLLLPATMLVPVRSGRKTQLRRLAASPLAACVPGDRLWVQEVFAPLTEDAAGHRRAATPAAATVAMMRDGSLQRRDGATAAAPDYSDGSFLRARWAPAFKMPRWASRTTLIVEEARIEPLQAIRPADAIAEGLGRWPPLSGGLWRWPRPHHRRLWRSPVAAYRWMWDATRGTPGERWADDPLVVVLRFRTVPGNIDHA